MSLVLQSSGGGSVTLNEPTTASNFTQDIPAVTGNVVIDSATQTLTNKTLTTPTLTSPTFAGTPTGVGVLTSGTAVTSTSGTSIDFTSIPSWVKRITVMFQGVSTNGTNPFLIQLGTSGGIVSSGYVSRASNNTGAGTGGNATNGFILNFTLLASQITNGNVIICLLNSSNNTWSSGGMLAKDDATSPSAGAVTLSATLTQLRLTTTAGTNTFDAGTVNILYE
jgi:hypothetical protein